ncbi:hypothetical protein JCM5350_003878 [Sporobolomyces pararoseus]
MMSLSNILLLVSLFGTFSLAQPVEVNSTTSFSSQQANQTGSPSSYFPSTETEITFSGIRNSTQIWSDIGTSTRDLTTTTTTSSERSSSESNSAVLPTSTLSLSAVSSYQFSSTPNPSSNSNSSTIVLSTITLSSSEQTSSTNLSSETPSSSSPTITTLITASSASAPSYSSFILSTITADVVPEASVSAIAAKVNSAANGKGFGGSGRILELVAFTIGLMILGF